MENNKLKTKPLTKVIMTIAEVSCKVWYYCRCKLWRQINDFDYYVFDLRSQYPNQLVYKHYLQLKYWQALCHDEL